jgi:hypothetical protein
MFSLEELVCHVDDFCQAFEPQWKPQLLVGNGLNIRNRLWSFEDCVALSKEFRELLMSAEIYAVRHRSHGVLYIGKTSQVILTMKYCHLSAKS